MSKILDIVHVLRNGKPLYGDYVRNRHCIVASESNGERTAYCFSVPIYRAGTNVLLESVFQKDGSIIHMEGSNVSVNINKNISFRNKYGEVKLITDSEYEYISENEVRYKNRYIYPSFNGITCKEMYGTDKVVKLKVSSSASDIQIRVNNKCFAFMREQFVPLMTVSCIGALDSNGIVVAPAILEYTQTKDSEYEITISTESPYAVSVLYEINMYEPKLFQDTTVESNNPQSNNAFGSIAFIGCTKAYGEQWLYIRPDMGRISDIASVDVSKVILHLPLYQKSGVGLKIYSVSRRFCSFGSNWNNKIPAKFSGKCSVTDNGYISFDITDMYADRASGYIIKPEQRDGGFVCVATGDNYDNPAVLEIRLKS